MLLFGMSVARGGSLSYRSYTQAGSRAPVLSRLYVGGWADLMVVTKKKMKKLLVFSAAHDFSFLIRWADTHRGSLIASS